jgi:hypothetical protein
MPPLFGKLRRLWGGRGWVELKAAQPMSTTIGQIEFELEKAEHGMGLPERVGQLRSILREVRKRKLSGGLAERRKDVTGAT